MIRSNNPWDRVFDVFNHLLLALIAFACIVPLIHLLAVSLSDRHAAIGGFVTFVPIGFNTISFQKVMESGLFLKSFAISIQRTILGTAIQMILTVLTAYPLSKTKREMPGRDILMWIVMGALLFNGGLIPWFLVVRQMNMLNTIWALIIPSALPIWNVILLMNFFREVPRELEEAALIDGANYWQVLWHVYLPFSVPALATLTLFSAVGHWNAWFDGMILIPERERQPLQTYLRSVVIRMETFDFMKSTSSWALFSDRSLRGAQIILTIIPILAVYPFLQRYFVTGIRLGAIKG